MQKNLFGSKIKEIKKNPLELEESLSKPKKYYDYGDTEYKGIRDVKNLFDPSVDEDHYKPIKIVSDFGNNNNCIECEINGENHLQNTLV